MGYIRGAASIPRPKLGAIEEVIQEVAASGVLSHWIDEFGFLWIVPDGTTMGPPASGAKTAFAECRKLYVAMHVFAAVVGKTADANADWAAGRVLSLPDWRGRVLVQKGQGSGLTFRNLWQLFGVEESLLGTTNMPPHDHGGQTGSSDPAHNHTGSTQMGGAHRHTLRLADNSGVATSTVSKGSAFTTESNDQVVNPSNDHTHGVSINSASILHPHTISTDGGGLPFTNVQPSTAVCRVISTGRLFGEGS